MDWKPIESAPRDGTTIIIWGGESVFSEGDCGPVKILEPVVARWSWRDEWEGDYGSEYDSHWIHKNPTHWMPWPKAPEID